MTAAELIAPLSIRPGEVEATRADGLSLRLAVKVRMDEGRMELDFPPKRLAACARQGLGMFVLSNDIPAHESQVA